MPAEYFKRLGMKEPPEKGDYFVGIGAFAKTQLNLDQAGIENLYGQSDLATKRTWSAKDYPILAAWLKANEKPLDLVVEAVKRSHYYNPLVATRSNLSNMGLISSSAVGVNKCRTLATALACRAMLKTGEKQYDAAWQDLIACRNLARQATQERLARRSRTEQRREGR